MIKIIVFVDRLIYYYIDTTQRDGVYQIISYHLNVHQLEVVYFNKVTQTEFCTHFLFLQTTQFASSVIIVCFTDLNNINL